MNKVILKKAIYKNFKGIKDFELAPGLAETFVYGDNGVGKTTLRDGYLWCLTGRDSLNRFNHEIKPLDDKNNVIHHLDSSVQLFLLKGDKEYNIKRVFREVWSRKTGDTNTTFDGNTTDFYVNNVKVESKSKYDKVVGDIFDQDLVQLLSDPSYFVGLKWQDQREHLFRLISVSDTDVVASNKELDGFLDEFDTSMLDTEKKALNALKRELSKDIQDSEAKLSENLNNAPEKEDWKAISKKIVEAEKEVKDIDKTIYSEIESFEALKKKQNEAYFKAYNDLSNKLSKAEVKLSDELLKSRREYDSGLKKLEDNIKEVERKRDSIIDNNKSIKSTNEMINESIESLKSNRDDLLREYKSINARTLSVDSICPTCGAIRGDIDSYRKELEEQFNKRKADDLAKNIANGKETANKIKELTAKLREVKDTTKLTTEIASIQHKLDIYPQYEEPKEIAPLRENVEAIKKELKELSDNRNNADDNQKNELIEELKAKKESILAEIKRYEAIMYGKEAYDKHQDRIKELEDVIRASNIKLAQTDGKLYKLELFNKAKNELCESLINEKFEVVKFTLFEYLNDGTPKPNCQALFRGIPTSTLNTGGVINVGLDIIRTFSKHFKESYPVFLDNKESVTKTIHIDSQVINLVVKEGQSKLLVK